jgi:8-oxo-dGTP pyrophosphatase MutT (NUDIX family)
MSDAFVFPGGKVDADDSGYEMAAVREAFEEAGVLLARPALDEERRAEWRGRLNRKEARFGELVREEHLELELGRLHLWSRWITPSVEPRRFDTRFYLAEVPPGQTPSFDDHETTEEAWVTPSEGLGRHAAGTLKLPPPQLRTLWELAPLASGGMAALVAEAGRRAPHVSPLMPRFAGDGGAMTLLFPWDPEYDARGTGEACSWPRGHALASGPSRVRLDGSAWRLESAPSGG